MSAPHESRFQVTLNREEDFRFSVDFDREGVAPLRVDEEPPLGEGEGPDAVRLLAAAVGNCLAASLLYCLRRAEADPGGVRATVTGTLFRNNRGRLRVRELDVELTLTGASRSDSRLERCLEIFEDYCVVTESVRSGIDVLVDVRPGIDGDAAEGKEQSRRLGRPHPAEREALAASD